MRCLLSDAEIVEVKKDLAPDVIAQAVLQPIPFFLYRLFCTVCIPRLVVLAP